MKPLVIVTTYNRKAETIKTLHALEATTDLDDIQLVVMDNHSTDNTEDFLYSWSARHNWGQRRVFVHLLPENIGCPAALNIALQFYRQPGQPVVKLDNDVEILTSGWVELFERFLEVKPEVALVGGLAYNVGFADSLYRDLETELLIPPDPEYTAAIGAALVAAKRAGGGDE